MKKIILVLLLVPAILQAETADQIIKKADKNQLFRTQKFSAKMVIEKGKRKLTKTFYGYGANDGEKSYMKFTNPEDRNVKYLKIKNELWIYFPDADDIMKISGHMLKQGMMGSDISYEDMLESENRYKKYSTSLLPEKKLNNRNCHVVELKAKVPDAHYEKQVLYIDKATYVPLKVEMYARGGRLLKVMTMSGIKKSGWRYIATRMEIRDMRKRNSKTTMEFKQISYDMKLPAGIFSRRNLKR